MKIKFKGDKNLKKFKNKHTDGEFVRFDATGKAQVKKSIGKKLIENYEDFVEHKDEKKKNQKKDSEDSE